MSARGSARTGPTDAPPTLDAAVGPPEHYSYAVYADLTMAARFDELRFGGPIGRILAESQERVLMASLGDVAGRRILDVGTGTGRAALTLARRGASVTAVDASAEMLEVAARRAADAALTVTFRRGDAHALEFDDRAFDAAVCLRVLMHAPDWRRCLGELCRVSRHHVVFDYPALISFAALQAAGRRVAVRLGRNVEAYRVLGSGAVARVLAAHGFAAAGTHRQFVLPIALHKAVGSAALTSRVEGLLDRVGLLGRVGSPVTVVAERCGS